VYVLKRVNLGPEEICSFVIGDACGDVYNPFHEWKVVFPPVPKPPVAEPKAPTVSRAIGNVAEIARAFEILTIYEKLAS